MLSHDGDDESIAVGEQWLAGARLRRKPYARRSAAWDHDHCALCWATFSLELPDALRAGYAVQDDPRHGPDYTWICAACYEAHGVRLRLQADEE